MMKHIFQIFWGFLYHQWTRSSRWIWLLIPLFVLFILFSLEYFFWSLFALVSFLYLRGLFQAYRYTQSFHKSAEQLPESKSGTWAHLFDMLYRYKKRNKRRQDIRSNYTNLLSFALEHSRGGVILLKEQGSIEWCNKVAENLLGISLRKDKGQSLFHFLRHPAAKSLYEGKSQTTIRIPSPKDGVHAIHLNIQRTDSEYDVAFIIEADELVQIEQQGANLLFAISDYIQEEKEEEKLLSLSKDLRNIAMLSREHQTRPSLHSMKYHLRAARKKLKPQLLQKKLKLSIQINTSLTCSMEGLWIQSFLELLLKGVIQIAKEKSVLSCGFDAYYGGAVFYCSFEGQDLIDPTNKALLKYLVAPLRLDILWYPYKDSYHNRVQCIFSSKMLVHADLQKDEE